MNFNPQLPEQIQQHLQNLQPHLQAEVLDFVLFLEQKQNVAERNPPIGDQEALQIHQQLMEDYAEAFGKLAQ